jgi:hypothetical protein
MVARSQRPRRRSIARNAPAAPAESSPHRGKREALERTKRGIDARG